MNWGTLIEAIELFRKYLPKHVVPVGIDTIRKESKANPSLTADIPINFWARRIAFAPRAALIYWTN